MANPNNCKTCKHKQQSSGGSWCYMFRDAPAEVCMQHTARRDMEQGLYRALHQLLRKGST